MIIGAVIGGSPGTSAAGCNVLMRVATWCSPSRASSWRWPFAAALGRSCASGDRVVFVSWPSYARLVRSLVLSARSAQYVVASRLLGASGVRILFTDIRPNAAGRCWCWPPWTSATPCCCCPVSPSSASAPSRPPRVGAMVAEGAQNFNDWWVGMFPGLAILTVVLAFNFIGDALRDMLDPRTARAVRL